jgi:hypothetical protein
MVPLINGWPLLRRTPTAGQAPTSAPGSTTARQIRLSVSASGDPGPARQPAPRVMTLHIPPRKRPLSQIPSNEGISRKSKVCVLSRLLLTSKQGISELTVIHRL